MTTDDKIVSESVLEHHAERIGIDSNELVWEARADGIITGSDADTLGNKVQRRYMLAGSLEDFCTYAKRLAATSR